MRIPGTTAPFLIYRTVAGPPIVAGSVVLTPVAKCAGLHVGPLAWARIRPAAVFVSHRENTSRLRVADVTRMLQLAAVLAVVAAYVLLLVLTSDRRKGDAR